MRHAVIKFAAWALLATYPAAWVMADVHAAMMYTRGSVLVNGTSVTRSSAIFAGDKLQVPVESAATITDQGSSIVVAAGSSVTFQDKAILLERSSAVSVSTSSDMAVKVETLVIAPAKQGKATFQVARLNGQVLVTAKLGDVTISDGTETTTVAEGNNGSRKDPAAVILPPMTPGAIPGASGITIPAWVAYGAGLGAAGAGVAAAVGAPGAPISTH